MIPDQTEMIDSISAVNKEKKLDMGPLFWAAINKHPINVKMIIMIEILKN
jgi:hypothetical protein